jgi:hypothetical protein
VNGTSNNITTNATYSNEEHEFLPSKMKSKTPSPMRTNAAENGTFSSSVHSGAWKEKSRFVKSQKNLSSLLAAATVNA